jgi:hypothetical protein
MIRTPVVGVERGVERGRVGDTWGGGGAQRGGQQAGAAAAGAAQGAARPQPSSAQAQQAGARGPGVLWDEYAVRARGLNGG